MGNSFFFPKGIAATFSCKTKMLLRPNQPWSWIYHSRLTNKAWRSSPYLHCSPGWPFENGSVMSGSCRLPWIRCSQLQQRLVAAFVCVCFQRGVIGLDQVYYTEKQPLSIPQHLKLWYSFLLLRFYIVSIAPAWRGQYMWQTLNGRNPSDTSGLGKCRHRTHYFHYMCGCGSHSCASIQPRVPTHKVTLSFPSTSPIQTPCIEFGCHFYLRNTD